MKKRPKSKAPARIKGHFPRLYKTRAETAPSLHEEANILLLKLKESSLVRSKDQLQAVAKLVHVAVQACSFIEALFGNSNCRPLVEEVARRQRKFAASFDLGIPTALRDRPRPVESSGDKMRRELTRSCHSGQPLGATGKTEFDWLRLTMDGFVQSVIQPSEIPVNSVSASDPMPLDWFLETQGMTSVESAVRARLLSPENQRNATAWADEFVSWYKARSPWPFMESGKELLPMNRGELLDPIHRVAFARLERLRKANPKEKSPWNALRAVVRERFTAAFRTVKVKSARDL